MSSKICEANASVVALLKVQQFYGDFETKQALQQPINLIIDEWGEHPMFDEYVRDYMEVYR